MKKITQKNKTLLITTTFVRILGPVAFIFASPFTAYLFNSLLDAIDGPVYKHRLRLNSQKAQLRDKLLDLWYYTAALSFSLLNYRGFTPILATFYLYRLLGQILFFATRSRHWLIYFPNLFEISFLYFYFPLNNVANNLLHAAILTPLFLIKIVHELTLHRYNLTVFDNLLMPAFRRIKVSSGKVWGHYK